VHVDDRSSRQEPVGTEILHRVHHSHYSSRDESTNQWLLWCLYISIEKLKTKQLVHFPFFLLLVPCGATFCFVGSAKPKMRRAQSVCAPLVQIHFSMVPFSVGQRQQFWTRLLFPLLVSFPHRCQPNSMLTTK